MKRSNCKTRRFYYFIASLMTLLFCAQLVFAQQRSPDSPSPMRTYCNPVNIDYGYLPIPNFALWGKHRTTADPVIVNYKGDYYLFSTNQKGYWWSDNMADWHFNSHSFLRPWNTGTYDDLCAPAVGIIGDTMLVFGSTYTSNFTIWMSTNPKANEWKPLVDSFSLGGWDPAFFTDDDGKLYMYNGSSNRYPTYGIELNRKTLQPIGYRKEIYFLEDWRYGWQRFGENWDNTFLDPFIEGSWMTKHHGKYYYQYAAPGTQFSGYADGVIVGNSPLGGFTPQPDPYSLKAGGFARGAGHGSTFKDNKGNYWHVSTIEISVKNDFERRIGIWPVGFDKQDVMWCNTAFGDYPHYLPSEKNWQDNPSYDSSYFTGWMLLNYNKPVRVSSTLGSYAANNAVDERIQTYWSAATASKGEYIISDLGRIATVRAVQINYADQDATLMGKQTGIFIQYRLYDSKDGTHWHLLVDKSHNKKDVPHDYVPLASPVEARYIKVENIHMPTGKFAISGLRVFGRGHGDLPDSVVDFSVFRGKKDGRNAWLKWKPSDDAYAYNIYYGTVPGKLYNCIMVYGDNQYWIKLLDKLSTYYFQIEAINENGVSKKTQVMKVGI
ncbi:family 43 glycosylhydrolase [Arachidicoccus ginsenosidivorans]